MVFIKQSTIVALAGFALSLVGPAAAVPQQAGVPITTTVAIPDTCKYQTLTGTIIAGATIYNKRQDEGPVPTLPPQAPYEAAAPVSVLNPGSQCTAALSVNIKEGITSTVDCGETTWTSTVTSAISIDCQGCNALQWNIGGLALCSGAGGEVVTASTPTTYWPFACATSTSA